MKHFFKTVFKQPILYLLLLTIIEGILFLTNYKPGTFLIGWDNVMPELNLPLNLQRALISVWQDYRGLGTLDGMAHAANLLHTIYIWLLSLVLPQSVLRYTFIHLTHLLGGIGLFFLLRNLLQNKSPHPHLLPQERVKDSNERYIPAFFGALFYMFNLGVIQMFYAPLEVFAVHFAALPFLALQVIRTLKVTSVKNYALLFLLSLLFSPQGFVPTVFLVFLMLLGFLLLFHLIKTHALKSSILVGTTVLLANAFWLLPYTYSALHTPVVIQETKINQLASEEIYYRNKAHGTLIDVFSLKGFMLTTVEYDTTAKKDAYFMQRWLDHTNSLLYKLFFFMIFCITGFGIFRSLREKRQLFYPFLATFLVSVIFLANNTPGLEQFNTLIRSTFPILGEAFRFPFTKFMTMFGFCFSLFFGVGLSYLLTKLSAYKREIAALALICLVYCSYPAFRGYFTSPYLRLSVPQGYFSLIDFMKTQNPTGRIALLPAHTFWNWQFRSWGHRGSGFLWYGLAQPTMERAFDPWSLTNEQFYSELAAAYNQQDHARFEHVLTKYHISYLLLDTSLLNSLSRQPINYNSLEAFLSEERLIRKNQTFGPLTLYKVTPTPQPLSFAPTSRITRIGDGELNGRTLALETDTNLYMTGDTPDLVPLFPSLSTEKLQEDIQFQVTENANSIMLTRTLDLHLPDNAKLTLPSLFSTEFLVPIHLEKTTEGIRITPTYPQLQLNNSPIIVSAEPITIKPRVVHDPKTIIFTDIKHTVPFTDSADSYLLNPYENTLVLSDGRTQETVILDTKNFTHHPLMVPVPQTHITNVRVTIPKFSSPFYYPALLNPEIYQLHEVKWDVPLLTKKRNTVVTYENNAVNFTVQSTAEELSFYLDNLPHQASYLMLIDATHDSGLPINYYVDNSYQKRAELESVLSKKRRENVLILPKTEDFYTGYGFHFIVKSVGTEIAKAGIQNISLYPFPQETISSMVFNSGSLPTSKITLVPVATTHPTLSSYVTSAPAEQTLVLATAYDPGWKAYKIANNKGQRVEWYEAVFPFIFGKEITEHTKVNNWQNGWVIEAKQQSAISNQQIVVVYLPQYLQYAGLVLTLVTACGLTILLISRRILYDRRKP